MLLAFVGAILVEAKSKAFYAKKKNSSNVGGNLFFAIISKFIGKKRSTL